MGKKIELNRDELYDYYVNQNKSTEECAEYFGVCRSVIMNSLKVFNIKKPIDLIIKLREKTNLEKYGYKSAVQNTEIQNKAKQTCIKRFGVDNPLKSNEIREKIKNTNLEKFGTEYSSQSEEVKEKVKQTNLERFGVECSL